ncbi:MAG: hypothetical protein ACTSPY_02190 [Candidatus Helarchaeota archaeon]
MIIIDLKELKVRVKQLALDNGAKLVGIGSQERLRDAPPSEDMTYCLKGARSCIIWAYPYSYETLKNYFSKKERLSLKKEMYLAYTKSWKIALKISKFIKKIQNIKHWH